MLYITQRRLWPRRKRRSWHLKSAYRAPNRASPSAQTIVDTLTQALEAARAALEMAHKSLVEARHAAEEAQAALTASRVAADAAEETKRLLEEPPPPRVPSPEPIDPNAETICEMKKDLDALRLWVDEQEAHHMPAPVTERDSSREREEEEEREASNMMIAPDDIDNDTDVEVRAPEDGGEADMEIDESRRSEEDAAQALVELAEQKITNPDEGQRRPPSPKKDSVGKGNAESLTIPASAESMDFTLREREALAREVILRKLQEAKREQVKIQKEQAQAAAAILILKERQDAAARNKNSVAQSSPPLPDADAEYHQSGTVIPRPVVLPPSTAETKVKAKKTKPVSGGVKLGPEITVKVEPSLPMDPSPEVERAAALGLRVRPTPSPPNSKTGPSSKKVRNQSVPPITHLDRQSPDRQSPDEISASRTGSDKGNVNFHIIPPTKAPKLPSNLSTDVQLMNLRHALQDEGVTWEAISRSRPQLFGIKTEVSDDAQILAPVLTPRATPRTTPRITPPNAPTVAQVAVPTPLKPLPSRKQLPKFTKTVKPPAAMNDGPALQVAPESSTAPTQPISRPSAPTNDGPSFEAATAPSTAQTMPASQR
ncbi:hypothetical protein B0H11DRAFT_150210 [Mycena galericulata]|nr:hypothetical protein B0H11DRAFT_150210 [Mycena galericulata]